MTNYLKTQLAAHLFRTAAFDKPSGLWLGLYTQAPTDSGGGTEVAGNGYARASLTLGDAAWSAGAPGTVSYTAAIPFPTPTGSGWGGITAVGIFDAASGGNLLFWALIGGVQPVYAGDEVQLPPEAVVVTVT